MPGYVRNSHDTLSFRTVQNEGAITVPNIPLVFDITLLFFPLISF